MKLCTACGGVKPVDEFRRNATKRDGLSSNCKPCSRMSDLRYRSNNQDRIREYGRSYHSENAERVRVRRQRYYLENLERERERMRNWQRENRDACARNAARRRARKRSVDHAPYCRAEIFARWGGMCCYCDSPAEHLDHVTPISRGGADAAPNLVPACAPCNQSKGAKRLVEWAATFERTAV